MKRRGKRPHRPPETSAVQEAGLEPAPPPPGGGKQPAPGLAGTTSAWDRFRLWLATPVDGGSLAAFRMSVGFVMMLEAWSLFRPSASTSGKVMLETYYTGPDITFSLPYPGFEWLPLLPAAWIKALVWIMGLAGLSLALGFKQRISAAMVFLTWGYLYAVESTRTYWMSYYYLELLVVFLLIWMPANRRYSLDAAFARRGSTPATVPFWTVFLLRAQLVITYFYAGLAKWSADWLIDGEPVRYYLQKAAVLPRMESLLSAGTFAWFKGVLQSEAMVWFISVGGMLFDVSVGFLLLIPRTRLLGLVLLVCFHATNHFVLFADIVWFPLLGVTTALIFLDPDWPARFARWLSRPRLRKPEWPWFIAGGLLMPVVGAALGWRARKPAWPSFSITPAGPLPTLLVGAWLVWQVLFPLRGALIPGDARVTFEGLSFSWRLKAEVYRSSECTIFVDDPAVLSWDTAGGGTRIDWTAWPGDRVLHRSVTPGKIDWARLPEVIVLYERTIGERVLYNPMAGDQGPRPEAECRERIARIWQELYARQPRQILRTVPIEQIHTATVQALRRRGLAVDPREQAQVLLDTLEGRRDPGAMIAVLRQITPFATKGEPAPPVPFLLIQDAALEGAPGSTPPRVDRSAWRHGPATRFPGRTEPLHAGGDPLVILLATPGVEAHAVLPQAFLFDAIDEPDRPPRIVWSYLKDLPVSKAMHVSTQPFLLRRYARRIADTWEARYGRRPAVRAVTSLSLNFRPPQATVDPDADLASVPVHAFRHNPWVRDLETPRIPPEALRRARPVEASAAGASP